MRTRLLACVAGGLLGAVVASPVNGSIGLDPMVALIACSTIGLALGYVASMFVDVFSSSNEEESAESNTAK